MRVVLALVVCSGCSSILGIDNFKLSDAGNTDNEGVAIDGPPVDAAPGCMGPEGFFVCNLNPTGPVMFNATTVSLNTDNDPLCQPLPMGWPNGQPAACFLIGTTIQPTQTIRFFGSRPLVMIATDSITINSGITLDAGGHISSNQRGPGSIASACTVPQPPADGNSLQGAGGAAGGTVVGKGGEGGAGDGGGRPGGVAVPAQAAPARLRGGCDGGRGGAALGNPGPGGFGGGGVYLVAKNRITINGIINVSGGGGIAGEELTGGGGGGSGGMLVLHAPVIGGNAGIVIANGGGGASGGSPSAPGVNGSDPSAMSFSTPAAGGTQAAGAGAGGRGAAGATQAASGNAGNPMFGGGGGGGGFGYIRANLMPTGLSISPAIAIVQ